MHGFVHVYHVWIGCWLEFQKVVAWCVLLYWHQCLIDERFTWDGLTVLGQGKHGCHCTCNTLHQPYQRTFGGAPVPTKGGRPVGKPLSSVQKGALVASLTLVVTEEGQASLVVFATCVEVAVCCYCLLAGANLDLAFNNNHCCCLIRGTFAALGSCASWTLWIHVLVYLWWQMELKCLLCTTWNFSDTYGAFVN